MTNRLQTGFLSGIFSALKAEALTVESEIGAKLREIAPEVVTGLETTASNALQGVEALAGKYLPLALTQVVAAAKNPDILNSEKRSTVITTLEQQLQADGHNIESDGVKAALGLVTELAVNIGKAILPNLLGAAFALL